MPSFRAPFEKRLYEGQVKLKEGLFHIEASPDEKIRIHFLTDDRNNDLYFSVGEIPRKYKRQILSSIQRRKEYGYDIYAETLNKKVLFRKY